MSIIKKIVLDNCRIIIRKVAEEVSISYGSCKAIFIDVFLIFSMFSSVVDDGARPSNSLVIFNVFTALCETFVPLINTCFFTADSLKAFSNISITLLHFILLLTQNLMQIPSFSKLKKIAEHTKMRLTYLLVKNKLRNMTEN